MAKEDDKKRYGPRISNQDRLDMSAAAYREFVRTGNGGPRERATGVRADASWERHKKEDTAKARQDAIRKRLNSGKIN